MKSTFLKMILLLFYTSGLNAHDTHQEELQKKRHQDFNIPPSQISYALIDLESRNIVESWGHERLFPLASISKLYTFAYVLDILGADYRFKTTLHTTGKIDDGQLIGDIYLSGNGDPYLTAKDLISLIYQLKQKGINKIQGSFYLDDTHFPLENKISSLGLEDQADNPSYGPLNVEFNRFKVWKDLQKTHPPLDYFKIKKAKKLQSYGAQYVLTSSADHDYEIWQQLVSNAKNIETLPSRDSSLFTGYFFQYLCKLHGLEIPSPKRKQLPSKVKLQAQHSSIQLKELASLGLEYSNNIIAEATAMAAKTHQADKQSLSAGHSIEKWLVDKYPNTNKANIKLHNASGLTLENRATSIELANFVRDISTKAYKDRVYLSLFPINAHSGSLSRRLTDPELAMRVYAKTGSLYFVNNLAGILIANSGKHFAFSILSQHERKRDQLTRYKNKRSGDKLRRQSRSWAQKSKSTTDRLLKQWIASY